MYLQRWIQHDLPNIVILQAHVFFGGQKINGNHQRQVSPTSDINPPSPPDWKEGYAEFKHTKVPGERSKNGSFFLFGRWKKRCNKMDRVYHVDVRSLLFIHVNTINLLFIFVYLYLYQYVPINGCTLINVPGPQMVWSPHTHTPTVLECFVRYTITQEVHRLGI